MRGAGFQHAHAGEGMRKGSCAQRQPASPPGWSGPGQSPWSWQPRLRRDPQARGLQDTGSSTPGASHIGQVHGSKGDKPAPALTCSLQTS